MRASERVRVQTVGRSLQNRPIQLVAVGSPAPATQAAAATGSVALFTCSVHGDENSGREACMQMARDLAFTTDPTLNRFLEQTTVLFVNPNPDGWVADTRGNADGVDVNRDYMDLATPEARAIVKVIRDWKPEVLNDLHEYGPSEFYRTDLLHLWPRNRNVDPVLHDLAQQMSEKYSSAQVTSLGYTSGIYGQWVKDGEPFRQVAGDGQAPDPAQLRRAGERRRDAVGDGQRAPERRGGGRSGAAQPAPGRGQLRQCGRLGADGHRESRPARATRPRRPRPGTPSSVVRVPG